MSLKPGEEVEATQGTHVCPRKGLVASLNVDPWVLGGHKMDMRVYVLVASLQPLLVFFRTGHLRVAGLAYEESSARAATFVTNPSFALALCNTTAHAVRPVEELHRDLVARLGRARGHAMWRRAQLSVRKAVLQAVFAVRGVWSRRSSLDPALTGVFLSL